MPKYIIQWKDPDAWSKCDDPEIDDNFLWSAGPDEELEKLSELGANEYLVVEFDTDAMTATVRRPK
jgi:hypothetical protein